MLDAIKSGKNETMTKLETRKGSAAEQNRSQTSATDSDGVVVTGQRLSEGGADKLVSDLASRILGSPNQAVDAHLGLDEGRVNELLMGSPSLN